MRADAKAPAILALAAAQVAAAIVDGNVAAFPAGQSQEGLAALLEGARTRSKVARPNNRAGAVEAARPRHQERFPDAT